MTRVACIQLDGKDRPKNERTARAVSLMEQAADADLIILPELWPVGFFHFDRYDEEAETLAGPTVDAVAGSAQRLGKWIYGGSLVERSKDGSLHNAGFLVSPEGDIRLTYRKVHLFSYQSEEARLLSPGRAVETADTPFGTVGATTCYDLRFPEIFRELVDRGTQIILVASAWPMARLDHWLLLLQARAVENQAFVVACNGAGEDGGVPLAGNSVVIDPWGKVLARAGDGEEILYAELDVQEATGIRERFPVLRERRYSVTRS